MPGSPLRAWCQAQTCSPLHGRPYGLSPSLALLATDEAYQSLFKPVMAKIMEVYRPEAIVLQCGE